MFEVPGVLPCMVCLLASLFLACACLPLDRPYQRSNALRPTIDMPLFSIVERACYSLITIRNSCVVL